MCVYIYICIYIYRTEYDWYESIFLFFGTKHLWIAITFSVLAFFCGPRCRGRVAGLAVAEDAAATGEPVFGAAAADDRRGEFGLVQRSSSAARVSWKQGYDARVTLQRRLITIRWNGVDHFPRQDYRHWNWVSTNFWQMFDVSCFAIECGWI